MDLRSWLQQRSKSIPVNLAAAAIAEWIRSAGITVEALREAAEENRPLLLEGLRQVSRQDLAAARAMFGRFASEATERDYLRILAVLEWTYPQHVRAISPQYLDWYRRQLDEARRWLNGSAGP